MKLNRLFLILAFTANGCAVTTATTGGISSREATSEGLELVAIMEQNFHYDESFKVASGGYIHYIKSGETIWGIAEKYGVDAAELLAVNDIKDPKLLQIGTRIYVPKIGTTKPPAKADNSGEKVAVKPAAGQKEQPAAESGQPQSEPPKKDRGNFKDLCWPVAGGQISSRFGERWGRNHDGIDMPAPAGTPVRAAAAGEVILAADNSAGYGNLIIIKHQSGYFTVYAHNKRNLVKKGDKVKKCDKIAEVGSTGRSTGPHCHFEIREGKVPQNPLLFFAP